MENAEKMFLQLFKKFYAIDENNIPLAYPDVTITKIDEYNSSYPFMERFIRDIIDMQWKTKREYPLIHLLVFRENNFLLFIRDYCHYLGVTYKEYMLMVQHSNFCANYIDNFHEIICDNRYKTPIMSKEFFGTSKKAIRHGYELFPAEFAINCLDKEWARKKYRYFQVYELYNKIKEYQFECLRTGNEIPKLLQKFNDNDQTAKLMMQDNELRTSVEEILGIKRLTVEDYVNSNPTLGYDRFSGYKYNWLLAKSFKKRGYRIDR